ncbi:DUF2207 domain-containing protein [Candidatus Uhrbacteria bacterium]|nr:DUF2207 domain-containing protein [Candidatus Uhrbacteria bacterium]
MNKRFIAILAVAFCLFLPKAVLAEEVIRDISVVVQPGQGRNLTFEENISYDFGDAERHGIYRDIPEVYDRNGGSYDYRLDILEVKRDGQSEPYSVSRSGGEVDIKIGDADKTITGLHTYTIRYSTDRAINFFDTHSELYWNAVGTGWQVPIEKASIQFDYLNAIKPEKVQTDCFTGYYGSTEQACVSDNTAAGSRFTTTRVLGPNEAFTVVWGFVGPDNFPPPTAWEKFKMMLADNFVLFIPFFAFITMLRLWWTRGRDPKPGTVIPEYEPPQDLTPALVGASMTNGVVPQRTVTATIIDLARRGFLKIRFGEKKGLFGTTQTFTFVKQKDLPINIPEYERHIFEGLFKNGDEQSVDDLSDGKFYTSVQSFNSDVTKRIDGMKLFHANPNSVRSLYIVAGVIIATVLFFFASNPLGSVAAFVSGVIICVFGWFMPRRTSAGIKLYTDILGFKWFLSVTEKDRMDFHNAPERTPEQFQALLPYAIVFGVENKWAAQFASMNVPPPDWATGNVGHMNTIMLASSLNSLHSTASSSSFSPPSSAGSGGSGFSGGGSGGGGGGGGGGSW